MVLGRAFKRWLGHKSRTLINRISAFIKEVPESSLALSATGGHDNKMAVQELGRGSH